MITYMEAKKKADLSEHDLFWAPIIAEWPKEVQELGRCDRS
jgi:hypothetical protein